MKLPAIQFYPGDWLRDSVAGCSIAAQGLWLRMMFLMHDSERYGYLQQNGKSIPSESIARRCGCTPDEYSSLLSELDDAGVFSRSSDGIIFSRRMVRDATERGKNADRQRRFRHKGTNAHEDEKEDSGAESDNAPDIGRSNASVTPLSQASSSSSSTAKEKPSAKAGADAPRSRAPDMVWGVGVQMLVTAGMTEPNARSYLGNLSQKYGKEKLAQGIASTSAQNPVNPSEYLVKVLEGKNAATSQSRNGDRARKPTPTEHARATAEYFGLGGTKGGTG
jgi:hypothetical protein